jgi:translocation and assembly module TamA
MPTGQRKPWSGIAACLSGMLLAACPLAAQDRLEFRMAGDDADLKAAAEQASLLTTLKAEGGATPQDLLAAARADYGRILAALYARGHYSAVIDIRVDGREAASIPVLEAPGRISAITVSVDPGPQFRLATAAIAPLPRGAALPDGFAPGASAESGKVGAAVDAAILSWREAGHPKAAVRSEEIVADHARAALEVAVGLDPGPRLRFGPLAVEGEARMRAARVRKIAGLPEGETFSETELRRAETRLRRTGIFSSVTLAEDDTITAPDLLGITATVVEQKPRRYSFGAEIASLDGLKLTGTWLHRNLLGGGERLKVEGGVNNLGGGQSGVDYALAVTLDRPATLSPDTTAGLLLGLAHLDEAGYTADIAEIGLSFSHVFSDRLTARAGLTYSLQRGRDPGGSFDFRQLSLPLGVTWDRRDVASNATRGFYLDATAKPFLGFDTTGSGVRATVDARVYRNLDAGARFVVAARLQAGAIFGPGLLETPRDQLFLSGGGGTVRGQPYQSLGLSISRGFGPQFIIGGQYFAAASLELRAKVTKKIGVVGFYDIGSIGLDGVFNQDAGVHSGAGLGLRYDTGLGPIRLDVATPVSGTTGDGVQFYIGLGQAF